MFTNPANPVSQSRVRHPLTHLNVALKRNAWYLPTVSLFIRPVVLHLYPRGIRMHKTGRSLQAPFQRKANKSLDRDRFEVRLQRVGGPEGSEMAEKLTRERSRGWETCSWISKASSALLRVCVNENTNNEHVPVDLACTYTRAVAPQSTWRNPSSLHSNLHLMLQKACLTLGLTARDWMT